MVDSIEGVLGMTSKDKEIDAVYQAMKDAKDARMYKRYQAIYLKLTGIKLLEKLQKLLVLPKKL